MASPHSVAEERANYLTHGAGVLFSLIAVVVLLRFAAARSAGTLLACSAYGFTLVLMFASSTAYHAIPLTNERAKRVLRVLDHSAIFLLIAGTYTALSLAVPQSIAALALLLGVWLLSALGVAALVRRRGHRPGGPVLYYLALSALVALALPALRGPLGPRGLLLLSAGGVVYALGVPFYLARGLRYHHMIWHAFVLVASALHFWVVIRYVMQG
ncbi:MAG TPA: hemolysin III family protein [Polyangiaceae bacterium]